MERNAHTSCCCYGLKGSMIELVAISQDQVRIQPSLVVKMKTAYDEDHPSFMPLRLPVYGSGTLDAVF